MINHHRITWLSPFLAAVSTLSFSIFIPMGRNLIWIILFGFLSVVYNGILRIEAERKVNISSLVLGFLFASFTAVGYELEKEGSLAIYGLFLAQLFGLTVFFSIALRGLFLLALRPRRGKTWPVENRIRETLLTAAIILLCWSPYFIAFFPGTMSSDALGEIRQQMGMSPLSNHHPVIHQLMIRTSLVISNWNVEKATAIYSIFQMFFIALAFAASITYIREKGCTRSIVIVAGLFYAVFPVNPLFAIMMEKGSVFAGVTVVLMLLFLRAMEKAKCKHSCLLKLCLTLTAFLFCTVRNNGLYAFAIGMLAIIVVNREQWKMYSGILLFTLVLVFSYQFVLFNVLGVQKSAKGEMLSIPIQQIARVIRDDPAVIETEEGRILTEVFPQIELIGELYDPTVSDPVKQPSMFNSSCFDENPLRYAKCWLKLGINHPKQYIEALLMQNYGYWFTDNTHYTVSYSIYEPNDFNLKNNSIFEGLRVKMMTIIDRLQYSSPVAILFSIGFSVWVLLFSAVLLRLRGRGKTASPLFVVAGLWLTTLASPVYCEYRYLYALVVCIPLFLPLALNSTSTGISS